ncbi:hypothetical protein [Roseiarcus sp.]|jgi:hypothetical protein|uniref:hypothetical protein n=1 Tax=Roseiarcus sp. TaxID=1969460 RepID=UPI003D105571
MPLFLIERTFADLVPTDDESMAAIKLVNDEIGVQWLFVPQRRQAKDVLPL